MFLLVCVLYFYPQKKSVTLAFPFSEHHIAAATVIRSGKTLHLQHYIIGLDVHYIVQKSVCKYKFSNSVVLCY